MSLHNVISTKPFIYHSDPLLVALNVLAGKGKHSPYRVIVVDERLRPRGVITGRRVLEVISGYRGTAVRLKKGIKGVMREPVTLFIEEARHIFPDSMPIHALLTYMAENAIGLILVVDERGVLRGAIDEESILHALKGRRYGIKVRDAMTRNVHTISPTASLAEAVDKIVKLRVRRLPVIDGQGLQGILTVTDILKYLLMEEKQIEILLYDVEIDKVLEKKVSDIMCQDVVTISPSSDIGEAIDVMLKSDVSGLPVTEGNKLIGILSRLDAVMKVLRAIGPACPIPA